MCSQLKGKLILNTRPRQQARNLTEILTAAGAEVISFPGVEIVYQEPEELAPVLSEADQSTLLVFTSSNGLAPVSAYFAKTGLQSPPAACIGRKTAQAASALGFDVVFHGSGGGSDTFWGELNAFLERMEQKSLLIACRGDSAQPIPANAIKSGPARVVELECYQSKEPGHTDEESRRFFQALGSLQRRSRPLDLAIITSGLSARNICRYVRLVGCCRRIYDKWLNVPVVTIGGTSASAVAELGMTVVGQAESPSDTALVAAAQRAMEKLTITRIQAARPEISA